MKVFEVLQRWTSESVVRNILGNLVTTDYEDVGSTSARYVLSRTWGSGPMFAGFDEDKYGKTGSIGLNNPTGTTPADIAEAAHEAFHAVMHEQGFKEPHDELKINQLAIEWCRKNLDGEFLAKALEHMQHSIDSYTRKPS